MMETKLQQIREHHAAFRKHIEETGNSLRYKELPVLTEEMFLLYEKTGNRLIYENEYFKIFAKYSMRYTCIIRIL